MIHSLVFDDQGKVQGRDLPLAQLRLFLGDNEKFVWVDMENATEEEAHNILGEDMFNFHPLAINDCHEAVSTPKAEVYEGVEPWRSCLFLVVHALDFSKGAGAFQMTELDAFIGKNFFVTWHTGSIKAITQTFERCLKTHPRGVDRLLHTTLDFLVENYQPAVDGLSEQIAELQDQVFTEPTRSTLNSILALKKQINQFRQIVGPQREIIGRLARGEFKLIRAKLLPYFRDVHDALVRIGNSADSYTDQLTNTLQVYLSHSSNQINEVVKVLTILNAISIPALVVASVYGMNFRHMPELDWRYGYAFALILIVSTTFGLLFYLKRKGWF